MNECNETSICKTLNFILELQKNADCPDTNTAGCDRPCLGPNATGLPFNTRPITLYNCQNGTLWSFPYTQGDSTLTSTVFKVIKVDCNCATFEILAPNPDTSNALIPYTSTRNFFTIDLKCVLAIRCLADTYTN